MFEPGANNWPLTGGLVLWLLEIVIALAQENKQLKDKIAALEKACLERSRKDSNNSHKPPSSDGFKKQAGALKRRSSGRKPGGQKGHRGKARLNVPSSKVAKTVEHKPPECAKCKAHFSEYDQSIAVEHRQVWEIPEVNPFVIEHVFYLTRCRCGHQTRLPVPAWMCSGIGDRLQATMAYLTAEAKLSRRTTQSVLREIFNVPVALGTLQNRLEDTSEMLQPACDELEHELTKQRVINIDETGYRHNKTLAWLWAFVTSTFAFFTIQASRGSKVIKKTLGETFDGIIICDRFSAYVKYHKDRARGLIQFCWAHIMRDIKATGYEQAYRSPKPFSVLMRQRIGAVFKLWHTHKRGNISREQLIEKAECLMEEVRLFMEENRQASSANVSKLCGKLLEKWESLFTFIYHEGVEPTNNLAERMIRPAVQSRKISYCTRSENGQLLRARLLTVSATCRIHNRSCFGFLRETIQAHRHNRPTPSLLLLQINANRQPHTLYP